MWRIPHSPVYRIPGDGFCLTWSMTYRAAICGFTMVCTALQSAMGLPSNPCPSWTGHRREQESLASVLIIIMHTNPNIGNNGVIPMTNVSTLNNINRLEIKSNEYLSVWKWDEILRTWNWICKVHDRRLFRVSETSRYKLLASKLTLTDWYHNTHQVLGAPIYPSLEFQTAMFDLRIRRRQNHQVFLTPIHERWATDPS